MYCIILKHTLKHLKSSYMFRSIDHLNIEKCGHVMCHKSTHESVPAAEGKAD
jgi:hypothetical protein